MDNSVKVILDSKPLLESVEELIADGAIDTEPCSDEEFLETLEGMKIEALSCKDKESAKMIEQMILEVQQKKEPL